MSVTAELVKELRERTGAGMMECKKYLVRTDGDIDGAIELMRKEGGAKAEKKGGRIAAEGVVLVLLSTDHRSAVIVEVNCETDFVARGDEFKSFATLIAKEALAHKLTDVTAVLSLPTAANEAKTLELRRQELVAKIGENVQVRRIDLMNSTGRVGAYQHGTKIGVLVDMPQGDAELAKSIAMHIAASNPIVVEPKQLPAELIEKEKEIYRAQAQTSGKPPEIIEKMIEGRVRKYMEEVCLIGQPYVKDPNMTVSDVLNKEKGSVAAFIRFEMGEGIEKKKENFAEEVMAQVRGS